VVGDPASNASGIAERLRSNQDPGNTIQRNLRDQHLEAIIGRQRAHGDLHFSNVHGGRKIKLQVFALHLRLWHRADSKAALRSFDRSVS